jgi:hypothetical protein
VAVSTADRVLLFLLRFSAAVLLLAAPCALLPFAWMNQVHRDWLGLGELPDAVITRYMARSLALVYAMHGVMVLFVTCDWERYRPFVPLLGCLNVALGWGLLAVDLDAGVPWWWAASEGPSLAAFGIVLLILYRRASRADADVRQAGR